MDNRSVVEVESTRNYNNRKPYRSKELKAQAKKVATKRKDGTWRCEVPVMYHKLKRE